MHKQAINHKQAIIGGGYLFTENACYYYFGSGGGDGDDNTNDGDEDDNDAAADNNDYHDSGLCIFLLSLLFGIILFSVNTMLESVCVCHCVCLVVRVDCLHNMVVSSYSPNSTRRQLSGTRILPSDTVSNFSLFTD